MKERDWELELELELGWGQRQGQGQEKEKDLEWQPVQEMEKHQPKEKRNCHPADDDI